MKRIFVFQSFVISLLLITILFFNPAIAGAESATLIPTPISPAGKIADSTPTFKWTSVSDATNYRFQVYKGTTLVYTKTTTGSCGTTFCTTTPTTNLTLGAYKWRVQAYIKGAWKTYSSYLTFSEVSPIPTLIAPTGKITDDTPTYKWTKIPGATKYLYQLYKGTTLVYTKTPSSSICGSLYCTQTPTTPLALGTYKWRVQSYVGGAWEDFSAYKYFSEVNPAPQAIYPIGTVADLTPPMTWTVVAGATKYNYEILQDSVPIYSFETDTSICGTSECTDDRIGDEKVLSLGDYEWHIQAYVEDVWKDFGAKATFQVTNPFIGSGILDGNGIPTDFLADDHIRKGFSYSFNWDTLIAEQYGGNAVQSLELPMPGMPGYEEDVDHYYFDLAKAEAEFKLADLDHDGIPAGTDPSGDVWTVGFSFRLPYNDGNTVRQEIAEIFAANLASINPLFIVEPWVLYWPEYLTAQRAGLVPVFTAGWMEDIHDPHNWYQPYTIGTYGGRQRMPDVLRDQFRTLINAGVLEPDPTERAVIYSSVNQLYFDENPGIPMVRAASHVFEQRWMEGRIFNPLFPGVYYYPISKPGAAAATSSTNVIIGDIDTLDPALAYDTSSWNIIQNVYDTLVFYEGDKTDSFLPQLAESWEVSPAGTVYTFHIREGVVFHEGGGLTASDVAYTFQRGLLQGGYASPQGLLTEPFLGVGIPDITFIVDGGASADNREALKANDPEVLLAACQTVKDAIVANDTAGTVTMTLAQPWGPFLATISNSTGSIMDKEWVVANGGWNGECDTWQNYYAMQAWEDPFTGIANGTGPYELISWTPGDEIVFLANDSYWRTTPAYTGGPSGIAPITNVTFKLVYDQTERYNMLANGTADFAVSPGAEDLVGESCLWNETTNQYDACVVVNDTLPLRLYSGKPSFVQQDVVLYNFDIQQ